MIFADTGYFQASFSPGDELHHRALGWSRRVQEPLLTTEYVLWECVNALSKVRHRPSAHALTEHVTHSAVWEIVVASPQRFSEGMTLHRERPDKDWSLTDCVAFQVMRERNIRQALDYDEHFVQAGFDALLRRDPAI